MARIARQVHKTFGGLGSSDNFSIFGSEVAGTPIKTKDLATIQSLPAWDDGFQEALYPTNKAILLEDLNSAFLEPSEQIAYIFQEGIPEWQTAAVYNVDSVVKGAYGGASQGQWFKSLQDANTGNAPPAGATNAYWEWINPPIPAVPNVGNALKSKLSVAATSTVIVQVTADLLSVQGIVLSAVNKSANISTSGAGGLDTGSVASSTWYAVHIISNADGSSSAALFSLSATAPTLPGGYTLFRRVGYARTNGSALIVQFKSIGDWIYWADAVAFVFATPTGDTAFTTCIAPSSQLGTFAMRMDGGAGTITWKPTGGSMPAYEIMESNNPGTTPVPNASVGQLQVSAAQHATIVTGRNWTLTCLGYYDPV